MPEDSASASRHQPCLPGSATGRLIRNGKQALRDALGLDDPRHLGAAADMVAKLVRTGATISPELGPFARLLVDLAADIREGLDTDPVGTRIQLVARKSPTAYHAFLVASSTVEDPAEASNLARMHVLTL
nr:hypothetical protein [Methylotetracoccus sp.]